MMPKNKIKFFSPVSRAAVIFLLFLGVFLASQAVEAAATSTIRGRALWTDGHGYVYFSCLDDQIGDLLDVEGNFYSTSTSPYGFHFSSPPCVNLVHGVYLNSSNNFSGQAWSPDYGLISFAATATTPSDSFRSHCSSCVLGTCSACYNPTDQKVYGYARVLGNSLWINLDNVATTSPRLQNYDLNNQIVPGNSDILAGDFAYDAVNQFPGTTTNSFLSFNCQTENGGTSNCSGLNSNYKVYISNLQIGKMSAPNWNYSQACAGGALKTVLKWDLKSGQYAVGDPPTYHVSQTAFEIVLNNSNTMNTSTNICYSGVISSEAQQYIFDKNNCPGLDYNKNYFWWIRLYDENNQPTGWYQFGDPNNGVISEVTDNEQNSDPLDFLTYKHEFPSPFFTWTPQPVLVGTSTYFTSQSFYYTGGFSTLQSCTNANCSYLWSMDPLLFGDTISSTTNVTTTMIFGHPTNTAVWLQVRDSDSYVCSTSTVLNVNYALPIWREVKAQ